MAQALAEILQQLDPVYNPQKQLYQQQAAALPGEQAAEQSGLDTAKTNAFGDVVRGANQRGMVYSGAPVDEQNRYVGEKYLPAVANLKSTYANKGFQLQQSIAGLEADKMKQAQGTRTSQLNAEADAAAKIQAANIQAAATRAAAASRASAREPSSYDRQSAFNADLMGAYQHYTQNYKPFAREEAAHTLAAQYGMPYDQVIKQVYSVMNDSWDNGQQQKFGYRK